MPTLRIVAAVIRDAEGRWLLVRKRGTTTFMQPGGKLEPGESAVDALVRELDEELGLLVEPAALAHLGRFTAPAANEAGYTVDADVFTVPPVTVALEARAEIEEARWVRPDELAALRVAPLLRDHILPRAG